MEIASPSGREDGSINDTSMLRVSRKPFSTVQRVSASAVTVILLVLVAVGILNRRSTVAALGKSTDRAAVPIVNVTTIRPGKADADLVLPGTTQSFIEAAVYARTNGYLKKWYFDIGAQVRQGQLPAEIETPELDQQLKQAEQDLLTARQNEQLALTTAERWQHLVSDDAVSKQEAEQYESDYKAKKFTANSAAANVERLRQLRSFEKIYAPFSGVITARNTDIGALIDAGAGSPKELFHISSVSRLRIYVSVPEADSAAAGVGSQVGLTLDEYPGRIFKGRIVRTSDAIDQATRTLKVEIDVDNHEDEIKTGAYILAHFEGAKSVTAPKPLTVPANALLFRSEGLRVALVRDEKAMLIPITVGRDFGTTLEVTSGLARGDKVILDPSDSLTSGTAVSIASENDEAGK